MDASRLQTVADIVAFAVDKEQEAADLYRDLAEKSERSSVKNMFQDLSRQEEGHKTRILALKPDQLPAKPVAEVPDLQISNYLSDVSVTPESSYQDILIFAMKREESAVSLYADLAKIATDNATQTLFATLADEERAHKLRLETEYDENVLTEN